MNPAILSYISAALELVPSLIAADGDLAAYIAQLKADLAGFASTGGEPTTAQWQAQNASMLGALAALQAAKPAA